MAEKVEVHTKAQEQKQKYSNSSSQKSIYNSSGSPADRILQLQKTAGNQAVQRLIKSRSLQIKPRNGQLDYRYKQKANKESMINAATCGSCKKNHVLQRAAVGSAPEYVPPIVHEVLSSQGQSLDAKTREFMELRFGYDFSKVRVHTSTRAEESARTVNALAYTVGNDVVFGSSAHALHTPYKMKILAHELTHVIQQRSHAGTRDDLSIGEAGSVPELEADRAAEEVTNGRSLSPAIGKAMLSDKIVQRLEGPCKDISEGHVLVKRGSVRPAVREAQQKLNIFHNQQIAVGKQGLTDAPLVPDCIFGEKTFNAILSFQRIVFPNQPKEHDAEIGNKTWAELDKAGGKTTEVCSDEPDISNKVDPLPAVPPFDIKPVSASEMTKIVKDMQPPGHPLPTKVPPGASKPDFGINPVRVTALPIEGSNCMKCIADWDPAPSFKAFMISGSWTDEPKRFFAARQGDVSGCPSTPIPPLLEVRKIILPEAERFIKTGEHEHYLDFVRSFHLTGGRYLANIRRLTPERTHIRAKDQNECEEKINGFLSLMVHSLITGGAVYSLNFRDEFAEIYNPAGKERDKRDHDAVSRPPKEKLPIFPNIDLDVNPFGCKAYFRIFDNKSFPGIPGKTSEALIKDMNAPPKRPWHAL